MAFGSFDKTTLDFSDSGIHVIFGRNEAGKSTMLRALTGLFYGIPTQTPDAYKHRYEDLRIGARLEGDAGEVLEVVRKKGRLNTLLDQKGQPIDDAPLLRMLRGVGEEVFHTTFGLSHDALQRGAKALLEGKGDLGESLFQAGLGGSELHAFLSELHAEADRIYSPLAKTKPLNEALRAVTDAQRRVREASSTPDAYLSQKNAISERLSAKERASNERTALLREQKRVSRILRMMPFFARRLELSAKRDANGEVAVLTEDAARDRQDLQRDSADASAQMERLEREIGVLAARRAEISAPEALADAQTEMETLGGRLGVYIKNVDELPRAHAEVAALDAEVRRIARAVGKADEMDDRAAARPDAKTLARIKSLASVPARLETELFASARAKRETEAFVASKTAAKEKKSERISGLEEVVRRKVKALGLFMGSAEEACELPVVALETIERFERSRALCEQKVERLAERRAELKRRAADISREIDALGRIAAVPTEIDLLRVRQTRDALWAQLRVSFEAKSAEEYERSSTNADDVADRLRRETERVTTLAQLLAEQDARAKEAEEIESDLALLQRAADEETSAWRTLWSECGIEPLPPAEMRGWLGRHGQLVDASEQLRAGERDERRAAAEHIESLTREIERHTREHAELTRELERWRAEWRDATARLGVSLDMSVDEARAVLEQLGELFRCADALSKERRRVHAAEEENERIAASVHGLAARHAPELVRQPPHEAGTELLKRFERARAGRALKKELDDQLAEKRAALSEQTARLTRCERGLDALMAAARVATLDELREAERRSLAARALEREWEALQAQLLDKAEGVPLDELLREAAAVRPESLAARLDEIDSRVPELEEELEGIVRRIAELEAGMEVIDREAGAASAADDAQEALARVRLHAERWIRVRLAEIVLSREIQRYREKNQGPVLSRASELFARLTRGSYAGLRAGFDDDDRAVLRAARREGPDVPVEALSDGTRDQLYLALRVASLERHAKASGALPLVLDDILIHFDDDRARAALSVLRELSAALQVLFFTHHQRLVDLAREVCDTGLTVHELRDRSAAVSVQSATP